MKEFRKNNEGFFICEECGKLCCNLRGLSQHIRSHHIYKEYFNKWIRENNEGICEICKKETPLQLRLNEGYRKTCSKKCHDKLNSKIQNSQDQNKKNAKRKQTCLIKYGVSNVSKVDEIKVKKEKTCLKNYKVKNPFQSSIAKIKRVRTWNKNFNEDNPLQNINILEKSQKARFVRKKFMNTNLWYQGSYELDFLNKYYDKFSKIEKGPSIKYIYNGKNKVYHSDFYISSLNLVVEIKSTWILNIDTKIEEKKKATIDNNFKYLLILDKNYEEFHNMISQKL